ncbi:hypothetical protein HPP92_013492 [Vanilla planifolia]|uniref:Uncharacterized protein n=1 Tax=Vanilla planifolia TaxID=51239 RepID=A0A835R2I4_VANPL|nr:hypothetical protein HPP92_013492 [Vanilla planifolia]
MDGKNSFLLVHAGTISIAFGDSWHRLTKYHDAIFKKSLEGNITAQWDGLVGLRGEVIFINALFHDPYLAQKFDIWPFSK